jgi:hypothetical protein
MGGGAYAPPQHTHTHTHTHQHKLCLWLDSCFVLFITGNILLETLHVEPPPDEHVTVQHMPEFRPKQNKQYTAFSEHSD